MEAAATLFTAIALLILLAATSVHFGVDSRQGFASEDVERSLRGMV